MDILYLVPHAQDQAAVDLLNTALSHPHNRPARRMHGTDCLAVTLTRTTLPGEGVYHSCTVGNRKDAQIYLPAWQPTRSLRLVFAYGRPESDPLAEPALLVWTIDATDDVIISDSICNEENKNRIPDAISTAHRSIRLSARARRSGPGQGDGSSSISDFVCIGPYRFKLRPILRPITFDQKCSVAFTLPQKETVWRATGRYIKSGGFGDVTCIQGYHTGELRALKTVLTPLSEPGLLQRAIKEVEMMDHLQPHDHLLPCLDHLVKEKSQRNREGIECQVLELHGPLCNGDLAELIKHKLALRYLKDIALHTISALKHMHKNLATHRDIKPPNILFRISGHGETEGEQAIELLKGDPQREVRFILADFGLSRIRSIDELMASIGGTFGYMASELYYKQRYGPEVDIFSFASALLQILHPWEFDKIYKHYDPFVKAYKAAEQDDSPCGLAMNEHLRLFARYESERDAQSQSGRRDAKRYLMIIIANMLESDALKRPSAVALETMFANDVKWDAVQAAAERDQARARPIGYEEKLLGMAPELAMPLVALPNTRPRPEEFDDDLNASTEAMSRLAVSRREHGVEDPKNPGKQNGAGADANVIDGDHGPGNPNRSPNTDEEQPKRKREAQSSSRMDSHTAGKARPPAKRAKGAKRS